MCQVDPLTQEPPWEAVFPLHVWAQKSRLSWDMTVPQPAQDSLECGAGSVPHFP